MNKIAAMLGMLLIASAARAEPPEAVWWRAQLETILAPVKPRLGFRLIRTEIDQSIVIEEAVVIFRWPDGDRPIVFTADKITIKPAGKLDSAHPLQVDSIVVEGAILNLNLDRPSCPATQPTNPPSTQPMVSLFNALKTIEVRNLLCVWCPERPTQPARLTESSVVATKVEKDSWAGDLAIRGPIPVLPLFGSIEATDKISLHFKTSAENTTIQFDFNQWVHHQAEQLWYDLKSK